MRPKRLLPENELWEAALKLLAGRALSSGQLRDKLSQKAQRKTDVDAVMTRLRDCGVLNDTQFAEHFAARRVESQGLGKARVLRDLRTRKVASNIAAQAVNAAYSEVDESDLIRQFLARKYRNRPLAELLKDPKELASAYRKLRMAGFSSSNSIAVLKGFSREADELESLEPDDSGTDR